MSAQTNRHHYPAQVKIIDANGQLSLGKAFAGKLVLIDKIDKSTWLIKAGKFIPESEKWLYRGNNLSKLNKAIKWSAKNKPKDNFGKLVQDIEFR